MKAIKHTNLKTLIVIAAALLSMASLAIPMQESRAGDGGGNTKGDEGIDQMNKCNDYATCVNMWCKAALECYMIIPQENYMRFPMPTYEESD